MPVYPILDTGLLAKHGHSLEDSLNAALDAGATWIQVRHKGPFDRDFIRQLERCAKAYPQLILNDRADYAALLGLGLHVGQDDLPPAGARTILGPAVLGFSTHNEAQLRAAAALPLDYLALGPIFPTGSKANPDPVVGLDQLRAWRGLTALPLVAIGGITLANAPQVLAAGANKVAVIGAIWQPPYTLKAFRDQIETWRKTLTTVT